MEQIQIFNMIIENLIFCYILTNIVHTMFTISLSRLELSNIFIITVILLYLLGLALLYTQTILLDKNKWKGINIGLFSIGISGVFFFAMYAILYYLISQKKGKYKRYLVYHNVHNIDDSNLLQDVLKSFNYDWGIFHWLISAFLFLFLNMSKI